MKYAAAATSLTNQIKTQWLALHPTIPVFMANEQFTTFDVTQRVVHVAIRSGAQHVVAWGGLGNNRYRQSIDVIMRIFVPAGEGEDEARALADDGAAILLGFRDTDLVIDSAAPAGGDATAEDGQWFEFDVIATGFYDLTG